LKEKESLRQKEEFSQKLKGFLKFFYPKMIKIKVVGVGGSGGNTVSRMKRAGISGVEFIAINTDYQDLKKANADLKLRIGRKLTKGLGTGMKPEIGEAAAREQEKEILSILKGANIVFITGGLGGGTFSGAAPVIAEISRNLGILTIGVTTLPFSFEGQTRMRIAKNGLEKLKERVDSLITIKNDKLLEILSPSTPVDKAFWYCDQILKEAVTTIYDLVVSPGIIKVNFADIKAILQNSGRAIFGIGEGEGEGRVEKVIKSAFTSPLLDLKPKGAKGVLFYLSGKNILISEVKEIGEEIKKEVDPMAKIIFGAKEEKETKEGQIKLRLIATGF
jgi:cell division protein FtsZ